MALTAFGAISPGTSSGADNEIVASNCEWALASSQAARVSPFLQAPDVAPIVLSAQESEVRKNCRSAISQFSRLRFDEPLATHSQRFVAFLDELVSSRSRALQDPSISTDVQKRQRAAQEFQSVLRFRLQETLWLRSRVDTGTYPTLDIRSQVVQILDAHGVAYKFKDVRRGLNFSDYLIQGHDEEQAPKQKYVVFEALVILPGEQTWLNRRALELKRDHQTLLTFNPSQIQSAYFNKFPDGTARINGPIEFFTSLLGDYGTVHEMGHMILADIQEQGIDSPYDGGVSAVNLWPFGENRGAVMPSASYSHEEGFEELAQHPYMLKRQAQELREIKDDLRIYPYLKEMVELANFNSWRQMMRMESLSETALKSLAQFESAIKKESPILLREMDFTAPDSVKKQSLLRWGLRSESGYQSPFQSDKEDNPMWLHFQLEVTPRTKRPYVVAVLDSGFNRYMIPLRSTKWLEIYREYENLAKIADRTYSLNDTNHDFGATLPINLGLRNAFQKLLQGMTGAMKTRQQVAGFLSQQYQTFVLTTNDRLREKRDSKVETLRTIVLEEAQRFQAADQAMPNLMYGL